MKKKNQQKEKTIVDSLPDRINDSAVLTYLQTTDIDWEYVDAIKKLTNFNDNILSGLLNVSVKTFRSYKQPANKLNANLREQVLLLLSLIKHGISVFGNIKEFEVWLKKENFYFDNKNPMSFLNTVTGIKFVNDRLTAIEFGDNV
jgi:uncharacterized protein (DUF2384 family)